MTRDTYRQKLPFLCFTVMTTPRKSFKLCADQIKPIAIGRGGCIATDMITVQGMKVGFMYRQQPREKWDSGWCFTAGIETQDFMDDPANHAIYDVNTIANYDPNIIPLLDAPIGAAFEWERSSK